jgi:hypothetical protein
MIFCAQLQGKNVTLESLMDAIVSIDIVPFCATIVTWLEFGAAKLILMKR